MILGSSHQAVLSFLHTSSGLQQTHALDYHATDWGLCFFQRLFQLLAVLNLPFERRLERDQAAEGTNSAWCILQAVAAQDFIGAVEINAVCAEGHCATDDGLQLVVRKL